jgi:hypothetical protein
MALSNVVAFYIFRQRLELKSHHMSFFRTHLRKPYPYEYLQKTEPIDLEIHEVTTGVSQSTGMSPTTESITPLNPWTNPGKYEHPCQVENLNPGDMFHHKKYNQPTYDSSPHQMSY